MAPSLHPSRIRQAVNQPLMRRWPKAGLEMRRFLSRAPHGPTKVPHCGAALRPGDAAAAWLPCWQRTARAPRGRAAARGPAGRGRAPGQRRVGASRRGHRAHAARRRPCPEFPATSAKGREAGAHSCTVPPAPAGAPVPYLPRPHAALPLRTSEPRATYGTWGAGPIPVVASHRRGGSSRDAWDSGAGGRRAARLSPSHHPAPACARRVTGPDGANHGLSCLGRAGLPDQKPLGAGRRAVLG